MLPLIGMILVRFREGAETLLYEISRNFGWGQFEMRKVILCIFCLLLITQAAWAQDTANHQSEQNTDTVTISRDEFDELKSAVQELKKEVEELKKGQGTVQPTEPVEQKTETETPPASETPSPETAPPVESAPEPQPSQSGGGKALALPDISLVTQAKGLASSDKRDPARNRLLINEAEIGIQGQVYPNVKADAFFTTSPAEKSPMQVEEAYLTYVGLLKGLNFYLGEKYVPFGRTNMLHSHSWPYVNRPLVLRNLVASENLTGQGVDFSYLLPTHSNLFAQLDLGTWSGPGQGEFTNPPDIVTGPGVGFRDRFNTARLWTGYPINDYNELELGGSFAKGAANGFALPGDGQATLTGIDATYRHFGEGSSRLLLRGEAIWRNEFISNLLSSTSGYYIFGDYKWNRYSNLGLMYSWSQFPQLPKLHESMISLILTKQFSEQYYIRLQGNVGSRPDAPRYSELWLQWVWGLGPHTHNLE